MLLKVLRGGLRCHYSPEILHNAEFTLFERVKVIHSASKYTPSFIYDCLNYKEGIVSPPLEGTQMKSQCKFTPICSELSTFLQRNLNNQKCRKPMCSRRTEIIPPARWSSLFNKKAQNQQATFVATVI